ncbi:MAG TPA: tetratricopeptide repeat protein [Ktedonobacteraceae bacterium]|nr:tetratricopeptide repeat protein [Ktedonobacteraceae bacterium]
MRETVTLLFRKGEGGNIELQVKESHSGRTIRGSFVNPYTPTQLNRLLRKLNNSLIEDEELREIGETLFLALCGSDVAAPSRASSSRSIRIVMREVIQRTLHKRGTVALTLCFAPGCEEFVRYPWELLHNGEHFLLASGIFTLTRALMIEDNAKREELPVYPPMKLLYIGASPCDLPPLETESSFKALARGLAPLREKGLLFIERLEPATYDHLVDYLSSYGGVSMLDEREEMAPCYAIHFDGHGTYGRLCPAEDCDELNPPTARNCAACGTPLNRVEAQTYLCFCDDEGKTRLVDTETLRSLLISSDVRLAVFSACETAKVEDEKARQRRRRPAVNATLATALVMSQVPAVVAMPFNLQDEASPIFMFHFYSALAQERTLEEALARARQAMLPAKKFHGWFIPVLYRKVVEGREGPVAFLSTHESHEDLDHPLAHLGAPSTFVGRTLELRDITTLLSQAIGEDDDWTESRSQPRLSQGVHHIALVGPAGIGKSALAFEAARLNKGKFPGGIIGVSLQGGRSFIDALLEIAHQLHVVINAIHSSDIHYAEQVVLSAFRSLDNREMPCLLVLDRFDEVQERTAVTMWHRFLSKLPQQVVVLATSHSDPSIAAALAGANYNWYDYRVDKMTSEDLLHLFTELAKENGLTERIHLDDPEQRAILQEICDLLDGYPLGAELIVGRARSIDGRVYQPQAATRPLEEVRDVLRESPLEGVWAVLDVAYHLLSQPAQLLLPYLSTFKLPFTTEQILLLIEPRKTDALRAFKRMDGEHLLQKWSPIELEEAESALAIPVELQKNWSTARDELVQASFMQFDGRVYGIHTQVRKYAHSLLPADEHHRVHRVAAAYYSSRPHPTSEEWFAAFEHLVEAGEPQDLRKAVRLAVQASWALCGHGQVSELRTILRRAVQFAQSLDDKTGEGRLQCCLGAILRQQGQYEAAIGCLTRSLALHREQHEPDEQAWALYEFAMLYREEGQFQQARAHAEEALELFGEAGDIRGIAWMHLVLGEVNRGAGRYSEALDYFERALDSFRSLHNDEGIAQALRDRGTIYEAFGRYPEALMDYEEALRLFTMQGLRFWQGWVLTDRSAVYVDQGKFEQAEASSQEALAIFRENRADRGVGWALRVKGDIARKQHNLELARTYYEDAMTLFKSIGDSIDQARTLNALAALSQQEGAFMVAREQYEQALALAHSQGARQFECRALRGLGDIARLMGDFAAAQHFYQEATDIANELNITPERCAILHRLGELYLAQQQYSEALSVWVEALALDRRIGHTDREALQKKVEALVAQEHLQEPYAELRRHFERI